ncbi:tryptophan synthase subunit beta [Candidatus Riflebacteria bacterium]
MDNSFQKRGRYGAYGGIYLPELLIAPICELEHAWRTLWKDENFKKQFHQTLSDYGGRPTPLTEVKRFSQAINGPRIFLKREDLLHTGAHKLNNAIGQCLLAKKQHKTRIIAETGAGQHGVATATACAYLGLDCVVYMGAIDMKRQAPNVLKMQLLGAEVKCVENGSKTLKDAVNEALRDWSASFENSHYCLGSALGPHPYPEMVAGFQSVIGIETKKQFQDNFGRNPDLVVACVGGGSNAIGIFSAFIEDKSVALVGVEAGGLGPGMGKHAARFAGGSPGVLHGCYSYLLQDQNGQVCATHSISAGLDYPSVGPQHAQLFEEKRALYTSAQDDEALKALKLLCRTEGIIPALESAHALAYLLKEAKNINKESLVVVNLSGRGDKDLGQIKDPGDEK